MTFYTGAEVSPTFMHRWRSGEHVGPAAPWMRVQVRRGRLARSWHTNWPNPQFGRIAGQSIRHQWYADWTPLDDWTDLEGVSKIDLDQSFDKNGITVATVDVDNIAWQQAIGSTGLSYHTKERGVYWPWRGWVPPHRPGSGDTQNAWYNRLPNAQILITQGYGSDTAVKTFTGLIDNLSGGTRPDRMTLTCRDFGGVLTDSHVFGWNKTLGVHDPISFVPHNYERLQWSPKLEGIGRTKSQHRWIIVRDVTDIVKCCLRWCGFKDWEVEDSGVALSVPYTVDKSKTFMDIINDVKQQLGYVFFIGEPTSNDLSIGKPIFRRSSVVIPQRSQPLVVRDKDLLTDIQPQHDNTNDRYIIRVRGVVNKKIGRTLAGDTAKRVTFTYWPPWMPRMSGVIKQLTYYNVGDKGAIGFRTRKECAVACVLLAVQIALARDTGTLQTPGQPALGLDSFAFVTDEGTGVSSRLYISNRKSTMHLGGDGSSQAGGTAGSNELLWATEIGGSLCDNPEFEHLRKDYDTAVTTGEVFSWGTST